MSGDSSVRTESTPAKAPPASLHRRLGHAPALDGLRGVAVLIVILFHSFGLLTPFGRQWLPGGFLGVDLFFVLSGFLITALLLGEESKRGSISFRGFYTRRFLRLLPALVLLLAVHFVYAEIYGHPTKTELATIAATLFYVLNWYAVISGQIITDLGHLWSLSVEEQFYLLWPAMVLLVLGLRRRLSTVVAVLVALLAAVVIWRAYLWHGGTPALHLKIRTDTRADGLLLGALLAVLWTRGSHLPRRGLAVAATVATAFLVYCVANPLSHDFYNYGGFTLVALACAIVILAVMESGWFGKVLLGFVVLRMIGRISYGLYLWHMPIMFAVAREGATIDRPMRFVIAFGLTAAIAVASWFLVERPFLRWKDRLEERRKAGSANPLEKPVGVEAQPVLAHLDV